MQDSLQPLIEDFLGCCVNMYELIFYREGYIGLDLDIMAAEETRTQLWQLEQN